MRNDIAAPLDDAVLQATRHEELAIGAVAQVARVQPPIGVQHLFRRLRVAKVPVGSRRTPKHDPAARALGNIVAVVANDTHFVTGQRPAVANEFQGSGAVGRACRNGLAILLEGRSVDAVHQRPAPERRIGQGDRGLCEPVVGHECTRIEPPLAEPLGELRQRGRQNRFAGVDCDAPWGQIDALHGLVGDLADAQFESEVRRRAQRALRIAHGPQPSFRSHQEVQWRENGDRQAVIQAEQPRADQAHVVIERQPADYGVRRLDFDRPTDAADVGQYVGVGQGDALGISRASGRVLDEEDVGGMDVWKRASPAPLFKFRGTDRLAQRREVPSECAGHGLNPVERDQKAHIGVLQDRSLPMHVLFDLIRSGGRIDRNRDTSGERHTQEAGKECVASREHDGHRLAGLEPRFHQARGNSGSTREEPRVANILAIVLVQEVNMYAGRIPFDLVPQHRRKRRGLCGCRMGLSRRLHDRPAFRTRGVVAGLANGPDPIRWRLRIADLGFRQARADSGLDAHQQFDAFEASQAEIAVEPRM